MKPIYPILATACALIGGLVGIVTRPSYLGIKVPMGVLSSSSPADAPFKSELISHLVLTLGIGLALGVIIAFVLSSVLKSNTAA